MYTRSPTFLADFRPEVADSITFTGSGAQVANHSCLWHASHCDCRWKWTDGRQLVARFIKGYPISGTLIDADGTCFLVSSPPKRGQDTFHDVFVYLSGLGQVQGTKSETLTPQDDSALHRP